MGGIQRYPMLQKKLEELEWKLKVLLLQFPQISDPASTTPDHRQLICDGIEARIDFLKNLVARELESQADGTPEQLTAITDRLASVESSFRNWVDPRVPLDNGPDDDDDEDLSGCSCTNSCFNEGEEDEKDEEAQSTPTMSVPALKENVGIQKHQETDVDSGVAEKQRKFRGRRNRCCILSLVIVISAVMVVAAANFGMAEDDLFLVPT